MAKRRRSRRSPASTAVRLLVLVTATLCVAAGAAPRRATAAAMAGPDAADDGGGGVGGGGGGVGGRAAPYGRRRKPSRRRILADPTTEEEEEEEEEEDPDAVRAAQAAAKRGRGHGYSRVHGGSDGDGGGGTHSRGRGSVSRRKAAQDGDSYFSYVRRAFHITDGDDAEAPATPRARRRGRAARSRGLLGAPWGGADGSSPSRGRGDGADEEQDGRDDDGTEEAPTLRTVMKKVVDEEGGGAKSSPKRAGGSKKRGTKPTASSAAAAAAAAAADGATAAHDGDAGGDKPKGALEIGSDTVGNFHGVPAQPHQKSDDVTRLSFMLWRVIKTYHIKSMVDVPCRAHGAWMPQLLARLDYDLPDFHYTCVDASPRVVKEARAAVGDLVDGHFLVRDWWARRLPPADLVFAWRGLDTAPAEHVHRLLSAIPASGAKYLLLGSADTHNGGHGAVPTGGKKWVPPINFRKAPFRLPQHPMRVIKEVTLPSAAHSRSLLLYQVSELAAASPPSKGERAKASKSKGRAAKP